MPVIIMRMAMMNPNRTFVVAIRGKREELKLSQTRLARNAGISQSVISKLEAGLQEPSMVVAIKLLNALDLSLDRIFYKQ